MDQPTGSCYLLKSEYLRQILQFHYPKITSTDCTVQNKAAAVNHRQGKPAVQETHPKNAYSRIMKKMGHEKKKGKI